MHILQISLCLFTKIFFSGLLKKTLLWSGANLAENLEMADRTDEFQQVRGHLDVSQKVEVFWG